MTAPQGGPPPFGALSVSCPVCHSAPGRACTDPRGYLYEGSHPSRRAKWLDEERKASKA